MTSTARQPAAFEVRFDSIVTRMRALARVAGGSSIGNELRDLADEMGRVRRDLNRLLEDGVEIAPAPEAFEHPEPDRRPYRTRGTATRVPSPDPKGRNGQARQGTQKIGGTFVKIPAGKRWCAGHNDGEGEMLSVKDFKVKNPKTGQLTSWCTACTRRYQQDRYVRVGFRRVTAEIQEGDACIGHLCPLCGFAFEIGERVQGSDVAHETCLDAQGG